LFQVVNILHLEYKTRLIKATTVSSEIRTKFGNSLYGHSLEFLSVKPRGTQYNQCVVGGKGHNNFYRSFVIIKKGKAIPLQPWTGPEGSRRLRLPDFKTIGT
jgi:hypothetical protein